MSVRWLSGGLIDVPTHDDWLDDRERGVAAGLAFPPRRADWRLGRWLAKRLLASALGLSELDRLRIAAADDGAPEAWLEGRQLALPISITHRGGTGVCALGEIGARLGCDLERVEPRSPAFVEDFFTDAERERVEAATPGDRLILVPLIWSAKESALKALRTGLRRDTRSTEVELALDAQPRGAGWRPLRIDSSADDLVFSGWWRREGQLVLTLAATPSPDPPERTVTPH